MEGLNNVEGGSTQTQSFSIGKIKESLEQGRIGSDWLGGVKGLLDSVGSQFNFFYCPISCLHLRLLNFKLTSHFANKRCFHFVRQFANWFSFSFHECKRENSSIVLNCHDLCIDILNGTYLWFITKWLEGFLNYAYLCILTLSVQLDFIKLMRH